MAKTVVRISKSVQPTTNSPPTHHPHATPKLCTYNLTTICVCGRPSQAKTSVRLTPARLAHTQHASQGPGVHGGPGGGLQGGLPAIRYQGRWPDSGINSCNTCHSRIVGVMVVIESVKSESKKSVKSVKMLEM